MFNVKFSAVLLVLPFALAQVGNQNWDLAVVINDQIELLQSNGTLIGSTLQQFSKLKALTFDNIRHQFVVSDMDQLNDTIFTVQLTKETDITPIIEDLPDDVQGLAIDPISDILYWTDSINRTINYVHLNDSNHETKILFAFKNEYPSSPQDIAIDICRRFIYWTNSNINRPTIERAKLDGSSHEILIDSDLHRPAGVAIDLKSQRLYWADMRQGIYYRIESTNLEGKERQIILEGTHSIPFGVAVDEFSIYWTDVNNNALWRLPKRKNLAPELLRQFKEKPMGLVAKHEEIKTLPDCVNLAEAIKSYTDSTTEVYTHVSDAEFKEMECLNGGELVNNACKCHRGFVGKNCEISVCHNFCVHGDCHLSSLGYPMCNCPKGFGGKRCERDMCIGFCLNDGICSTHKNSNFPTCICSEEFVGTRCETSVDITNICTLFCQQKENDVLISQNNEVICRCGEHGSFLALKSNASSPHLAALSKDSLVNHLKDPTFLLLSSVVLIMLIVIIVLSAMNCSMRRRPRIKKRIIVNKNVTPLTYRPQPTTEQCEITIENCCNMNVCETPCFEPPQLRAKKDDKKTLLSNMENGEDMY